MPTRRSSFAPEEEEEEFRIVRTKKFPIKPMTVEEAVLQMNLVGHTFFAFKNEEDGRRVRGGLQAQRRRLRPDRGRYLTEQRAAAAGRCF